MHWAEQLRCRRLDYWKQPAIVYGAHVDTLSTQLDSVPIDAKAALDVEILHVLCVQAGQRKLLLDEQSLISHGAVSVWAIAAK